MKILVLGGDGYLGWPTAMHFSALGEDVRVVDSYLRRRLAEKVGTDSLTPIEPDLRSRVAAWHEVCGRRISVVEGDLTEWHTLRLAFEDFRPDTVVHFGEMPSNPYSMAGREEAVLTQYNNVIGTLNVLFAIREFAPEAHLLKLGSMGAYGQPNIDLEEGYLEVRHGGRAQVFPYPKLPNSFYQCTKSHDTTNLHFAARLWRLRVTDLNQGIVYGIETSETQLDPRLATRFDYDDYFGTPLNRFCLQVAVGHPLTVYGSGGQTRTFLNIRDTLRCLELAAEHPAEPGEMRVFNQFTEQFSVRELAELVLRVGTRMGFQGEIAAVPNPRVESEHHYYNAIHTKLPSLGLQPHLLTEEVVERMITVIVRHRERVNLEVIRPRASWR